MAAQYSNRQFFKKTLNQYFAQFFEAKGILRGKDLAALDESDADVLQDA